MLSAILAFFQSKAGIAVLIAIIAMPIIFVVATEPGTVGDPWTEGGEASKSGYAFKANFDDNKYATAWISNMDSESITLTTQIKRWAVITGAEVKSVRFNLYFETMLIKTIPETGWINVPDINFWEGGQWYTVASQTTTIKGELVGRLKVELVVKIDDMWPYPDFEGEVGAWDGAYLESGRGQIYLYGDQGPFEEGESARVYVSTGYTGIEAGWTVRLNAPPDRTDLFTVRNVGTIPDNADRIVSILIEDGWFKIGSTNTFTVELWNHLFDVGFTQIFTIDLRERAPGTPVITRAWTGNLATITVSSQRTYADIDTFIIWAWYGEETMPSLSDGESWVQNGVQYQASPTGTGNYTAMFTIQAKNQDGNIRVKIIARDVEGRSSAPGYLELIVENGNFEDARDPTISQPFLWTWLVVIIITLGFVIGAICLISLYKAQMLGLGVALFLICVLIFCLLAYFVGNDPSLAPKLGYVMIDIRQALDGVIACG